MRTDEILQHDLVIMMTCRPIPKEAEVLARRIVNLIYDAAQESAEVIMIDHIRTFNHLVKGN